MQAQVITVKQARLIECLAGVESLDQALELVALCAEHDAPCVLLAEEALPPALGGCSGLVGGAALRNR